MSMLTIRLPDDKHERLKLLAEQQMRFLARAAKGSPKEGLKLLSQLDKHFDEKK